jgi:transposase-like protein
LSEQRRDRKLSAQKKAEIVLAGLRGDRSVRDLCREHDVSEALYYSWRDKLLSGDFSEWAGQDSNLRPTDYESAALTS